MIAITTSNKPTKKTLYFVQKILNIVPNSIFFKRKDTQFKQILRFFKKKNINNSLTFIEKKKTLAEMWYINTDQRIIVKFKIKSFIVKKNLTLKNSIINCKPELVFYNFKNKIGNFLALFLFKVFQNAAQLLYRQVLFFYLAENCVIMRIYRYSFSFSGKDIKLQEIGPRVALEFLGIASYFI